MTYVEKLILHYVSTENDINYSKILHRKVYIPLPLVQDLIITVTKDYPRKQYHTYDEIYDVNRFLYN